MSIAAENAQAAARRAIAEHLGLTLDHGTAWGEAVVISIPERLSPDDCRALCHRWRDAARALGHEAESRGAIYIVWHASHGDAVYLGMH